MRIGTWATTRVTGLPERAVAALFESSSATPAPSIPDICSTRSATVPPPASVSDRFRDTSSACRSRLTELSITSLLTASATSVKRSTGSSRTSTRSAWQASSTIAAGTSSKVRPTSKSSPATERSASRRT